METFTRPWLPTSRRLGRHAGWGVVDTRPPAQKHKQLPRPDCTYSVGVVPTAQALGCLDPGCLPRACAPGL